jgi:hypothetical protein
MALLGPFSQHVIFFLTHEWTQKARVLARGRSFHSSLLFAGKARSLPYCGATEMCFTWIASGLDRKHQNRLEKFAKKKHSSLLGN